MTPRSPNPIEKLTIPGRLLLVVTFLLFGGGFFYSFLFVGERMPPGQYPLVVVCLPILLVCFFFFLAVAWLLEKCGIRIYVKPPER